jgi:hypothetical protein
MRTTIDNLTPDELNAAAEAANALSTYAFANRRGIRLLSALREQSDAKARKAQGECEAMQVELIHTQSHGRLTSKTWRLGEISETETYDADGNDASLPFGFLDIVTYAHDDGILYLGRIVAVNVDADEYSIECRSSNGKIERTDAVHAAQLSRVPSAYSIPSGQFDEAEQEEKSAPKNQTPGAVIDSLFAQVDEEKSKAFASFMRDVIAEVARAMAIHPSVDVMGTAVGEEYGELCKALLDEPYANVYTEATQLAATCARIVVQGDRSHDLHRAIKGHDPLPGSPYVAGPDASKAPQRARLADVICGAMRTHTPDRGHMDEWVADCIINHIIALPMDAKE